MDSKPEEEKIVLDSRLQNILNCLSRCKIDFTNENEECRKLREANLKLEVELKEVREMEKSHRYHLLTSREMIGNLQETVSQLVYLKRDIKKLKEQLSVKESNIADVEKDKENVIQKQNDNVMKLRSAYEKQIEEMKSDNKRESGSDTEVKNTGSVPEHYLVQLQEELARETARTDLNIDAYRRRLEELEEKLKQSQFKQYLQNSYPSQYENHVERPYSANREPYTEYHSIDSDPVHDMPTNKFAMPSQNKAPKPNSLQVIYYDKNVADTPKPKSSEKKGLFHITKKRKLYNDKDFQDF
ncbi:unnamed protein product [Spodoptera littoralis]|uniref:Uncharacterized protein n=1 Tax=Spodoptera littoralis TaxID=7109 RepID=A0A9P0IHL4_SPOLI|nr:unnamed protein product [Spodoptera littoralis]CAH1645981.1 unnamed protein product [Spodoptera littoralis]